MLDAERILSQIYLRDVEEAEAFWKRWRENRLTPMERRQWSSGVFLVWGVRDGKIQKLSPGE